MAEMYSVEWFREIYQKNPEWLGEQARQLWKLYEGLEQEFIFARRNEAKREKEMDLWRESVQRQSTTIENLQNALEKQTEDLAADRDRLKEALLQSGVDPDVALSLKQENDRLKELLERAKLANTSGEWNPGDPLDDDIDNELGDWKVR